VLLRQGDPGGFLFAIERGRVKLLAHAEDGAQLLITVRGGGHLIGELADDEENGRNATVVTIDQCIVRYFARPAFDRLLTELALDEQLRRYVVRKVDQSVERQLRLAHRSAASRLAGLLLDLARLAPPGIADPLRIPFTQHELSASLGLTRSTVAAQLRELRQAGALRPGPRIVVADTDVLDAIASDRLPVD
jgi:CRP-like cAMP-binding protein